VTAKPIPASLTIDGNQCLLKGISRRRDDKGQNTVVFYPILYALC
jgi:hypothetical protein